MCREMNNWSQESAMGEYANLQITQVEWGWNRECNKGSFLRGSEIVKNFKSRGDNEIFIWTVGIFYVIQY